MNNLPSCVSKNGLIRAWLVTHANPGVGKIRMKSSLIRIVSLAACVLVASCSKQDQTETTAVEPATPAPVAATPEPVKVVAATPAPKRLAPDGTYFLTVKKSVETPDGIFGLKPGTQVLRQADGKYTADGHVLELQASEITNDLDIAARYAGADARAQSAIKQTLQARPAAPPPTTTAAVGGSTASRSTTTPANGTLGSTSSTVAPTQRSNGSMLDGSSALGSAHTKVQGGWLYQKDASGNWTAVRPVR